jgi:hypothetical protein
MDSVGRVFWGAQSEKQRLPAPKQPKSIEAPKSKIEPPKPSEMDDDIPF